MKIQNHWKFLFLKGLLMPIIAIILFSIIFCYNPTSYHGEEDDMKFLTIYIGIVLFIIVLPIFYLHYSYFQISKNVLVEKSGIRIKDDFYSYEDVRQIWVNKVRYDYRNPFADYFYVKLVLDKKKEIFLTTLLDDDIDKAILNRCRNARVFYEYGYFSGFPEW